MFWQKKERKERPPRPPPSLLIQLGATHELTAEKERSKLLQLSILSSLLPLADSCLLTFPISIAILNDGVQKRLVKFIEALLEGFQLPGWFSCFLSAYADTGSNKLLIRWNYYESLEKYKEQHNITFHISSLEGLDGSALKCSFCSLLPHMSSLKAFPLHHVIKACSYDLHT